MALMVVSAVAAETPGSLSEFDPETGLLRWQIDDSSFSLQLTQRIPDQTRAFFLGRGFSRSAVERLATRCVFQAIARNTSKEDMPVRFDLSKWRARVQGNENHPLLDSYWQKIWIDMDESSAARIAFRWSLLPTIQTYQAGDWNMGMTIINASAGDSIDLRVVWYEGEVRHTSTIEGVICGG